MKMLYPLVLNVILFISCFTMIRSQEMLIIGGHLKIGGSQLVQPASGTIRWTGVDFEGYNGFEWISLTGAASEGSIEDIDHHIYKTIRIGDQEWMGENLRTSRYRNGISILNVSNNQTWSNLNTGAWCWYENNNTYDLPYGKLYNWFAVNDPGGLCPEGWRVPEENDWLKLAAFLGGTPVAGEKLKESGTDHWVNPNLATNSSGFSALPGGHREIDGSFFDLGSSGIWWSADELIGEETSDVEMTHHQIDLNPDQAPKRHGNSVRCIKN